MTRSCTNRGIECDPMNAPHPLMWLADRAKAPRLGRVPAFLLLAAFALLPAAKVKARPTPLPASAVDPARDPNPTAAGVPRPTAGGGSSGASPGAITAAAALAPQGTAYTKQPLGSAPGSGSGSSSGGAAASGGPGAPQGVQPRVLGAPLPTLQQPEGAAMYGWLAALHYPTQRGPWFACGGTLIKPNVRRGWQGVSQSGRGGWALGRRTGGFHAGRGRRAWGGVLRAPLAARGRAGGGLRDLALPTTSPPHLCPWATKRRAQALHASPTSPCLPATVLPPVQVVLTAAHCTMDDQGSPRLPGTVKLGWPDLTDPTPPAGAEVLSVAKVVPHPGFSARPSPATASDLAILVLSQNSSHAPAALPPRGMRPLLDRQRVWAAGYRCGRSAEAVR